MRCSVVLLACGALAACAQPEPVRPAYPAAYPPAPAPYPAQQQRLLRDAARQISTIEQILRQIQSLRGAAGGL